MNHPLKSACIAGAFALASTPAFADATMVDVLAQQSAGKALHLISAKMDHDAKDHLFNITIGTFGVVDKALGQHDADYEAVLSARGMALGAAAYGTYDADFDAVFTPAAFFETAALGQHDAGYEAALQDRGMVIGAAAYGAYDADVDGVLGARITAAAFGNYDADYDGVMTKADFFSTAALGQYDAGYEPVLTDRGVVYGAAVYGKYDADYAPFFTPIPGCTAGVACF